MIAMDYYVQQPPHKYTCSTMSSETLSGSCGSRSNRTRTVRLVRPSGGHLPPNSLGRNGPALGFSIRGGREHGTGFFVSSVVPGSEAQSQGLRIGDQIIRINGFTVEDAIHKEVLQLISSHTHLTLKVRSVGMIPVKDKKSDSLSWQIISDSFSSSRSSPQLDKNQDVRINIVVAPRSKLGCGVCKGPEWKPGIFIQFTKEGGVAREAGLRPGDQILYCNNVDFYDIPFNEAVNIMKNSRQLDLIVRKSAGSELFPGESSGYNSSASSVTGDQSPSWSDSKRLSIVKEEITDRSMHLNKLNTQCYKNWNTIEWEEEEEQKPYFKPTIINLSENGTTIKNNGSEYHNIESLDKLDACMVSRPHETKTVVVEVHRSDVEAKEAHQVLEKSPSICSFNSATSKQSSESLASSSLSSAICMEIHRRNQRKDEKPSIDEQLQMKKILKGVSSDQQHQHSKLMDEFKKAHMKMFKNPEDAPQSQSPATLKHSKINEKQTADRLAHEELSQKLSERLSILSHDDGEVVKLPTSHKRQVNVSNPPPPPPPPPLTNDDNGNNVTPSLSLTNGVKLANSSSNNLKPNKIKPKAPPVPVKHSTLSSYQPPPCPTPDYDTLSISSSVSNRRAYQISNDSVDMESLDSYKIHNPSSDTKPKPPNVYFLKTPLTGQKSNGSNNGSTLKQARPVSVTIGEYSTSRRPGKLGFLNQQNGKDDLDKGKQDLNNQLANELTMTLSRSNLRKRTESMEDLLQDNQIKSQRNGTIRISLNNGFSKSFCKSTNDLTSDIDDSNRVTINVGVDRNKKQDCQSPNGILKSSAFATANILPFSTAHKPLVQQKSITFGDIPTVIKDHLQCA